MDKSHSGTKQNPGLNYVVTKAQQNFGLGQHQKPKTTTKQKQASKEGTKLPTKTRRQFNN